MYLTYTAASPTSYANNISNHAWVERCITFSVAYGSFEGLGKIKEKINDPQIIMPTPKHSLLAKTIM